MRSLIKTILLFVGLLVIVGGIFLAWFVPTAFFGKPTQQTVKIIVLEHGTSDDVAQTLADKGAIVSSFGYRFYAMLDATARYPKPGDYDVALGSSYRAIARQLALGPTRNETEFKLLEGATVLDETNLLISRGVSIISVGDLVGDPSRNKPFAAALRQQYDFLKDLPSDATLEGYLFPDTYRVWKDQLPLGLVLKQLNRFAEVTDGFAEQAKKQGRSFAEVVTLASIVEKEGRTTEERRMIAQIFLNRIKGGMRLQSDATVNYATKANRARPTLDDLQNDSPYNTYRHDGLPPGPICNPGKDSLEAALNPTPNDYYYYLHDDTGKIYYAKTIEEHRVNRAKAYGE